ncbi:CoA-binding protein [Flavobacteriaceae bacterium F08102]|nr:CoA-binding protein [Flavobacteriaceae bacterium F08102]
MHKPTLVIGASTKQHRYSNKAVKRLVDRGEQVYAIGVSVGEIYGIEINVGFPVFPPIHTVTLYINPIHQSEYMAYIIGLHPARVIFNPGTENKAFVEKLEANGIEVVLACTLVLIATNQY